jgi:prevent-host-death family protein
VPTKITATELSRNLSDILNRVRYKGEAFAIERNGQTVAVLSPPKGTRKATWRTLAEIMERHQPADPSFADDLEKIHQSQGLPDFPEWLK